MTMKTRIKAVLEKQDGLTDREGEIAEMLCEGLSNKAIANRLAISLCTVHNHLRHIYTKLEIQRREFDTRCAAISLLIGRGMIKVQTDERPGEA